MAAFKAALQFGSVSDVAQDAMSAMQTLHQPRPSLTAAHVTTTNAASTSCRSRTLCHNINTSLASDQGHELLSQPNLS